MLLEFQICGNTLQVSCFSGTREREAGENQGPKLRGCRGQGNMRLEETEDHEAGRDHVAAGNWGP